jgi:hypothetical protein
VAVCMVSGFSGERATAPAAGAFRDWVVVG